MTVRPAGVSDLVDESVRAIRCCGSVEAVSRAAVGTRSLVDQWVREGAPAEAIVTAIAEVNDAVMQRLIEVLDRGGVARAADACWIVLGSQGRREQTLATDQDNALVLPDDASPAWRGALLSLAAGVNAALADCGFPLCRGGIMARNEECCLTLAAWRARFAQWLEAGDPQALLGAAIYFDLRPVHGARAPCEELRRWLARSVHEHSRFLLQLTHNALANQPPLGVLRDFVVARGGDHPGTIDLKVNGVQPFVEAARIYALAAGVVATSTIARLREAGPPRRIPVAETEAYIDAFRFIQRMRLRLNSSQRQQPGSALHNHLDPRSIDADDRRMLKQAFRQARLVQARLARDFGAMPGGFGA